jgi:thiamine kinase-like enzyme
LPLLAEVEALVAARAAEAVPLVMTHSDLVPGNVLVSAGGRPWIMDWDDAGPWNAAEEVAAAVVSRSSRALASPMSGSHWRWWRATAARVVSCRATRRRSWPVR